MSELPPRPRWLRVAVATWLCVCAVAACASTRHTGSDEPDVVESTTELSGNPVVENDLEVVQPHVDESGNSKTLKFDLRNRSTEQRSFAYTVVWSDRNDKRVGAPQRRWTRMTLDGGASAPVTVVFPADSAESWRLLAVRPEEVR